MDKGKRGVPWPDTGGYNGKQTAVTYRNLDGLESWYHAIVLCTVKRAIQRALFHILARHESLLVLLGR